jgi:alanine-glyoxylate transaminase/serine-glyoxylate transaminase/serine-pyruvate transaminase
VWLPEGFEDKPNRARLLQEFGIEIAGGLGQFAGKVWRIGLMGHTARRRNVTLLLAALGEVLTP